MCYTNNVNKKWKKGWHKYIKSIIIEKRKADKTMGFFDKLKNGLNKTKTSFDEKINNVFKNFRKVDEEFLDELEEVLIMSDIGMETSIKIISNLREKIKKEKIQDEEEVKQALREEMQKILDGADKELHLNTKPSVILVVGVNGVGKTTSIGKMANRLAKDGKKVVVAAADTFRAAAVEQLEIWAKRAGAYIVKRDEGVDPASVVFDAIKKTRENGADVLIVDTAGRLHNKKYLMDELNKIQKVINKEMPEADKEVLLVIDGTTGQNAISQVKAFKQETDITGIVLTKLDGTAKGGVVIGIVEENKIPVKFIGVGEQIDDMEIFNSEDFVKAII
jgi:fused signal recognition particle receptor